MLTMVRMAWRNLFRNSRRTMITAASIGLGLALLLISVALVEGMLDQMTRQMTGDFMGHGQVHAVGYQEKKEVTLTVPDGLQMLERVEKDPRVDKASPRLYSFGLVATSNDSKGVRFMGVDAEKEPQVTTFHERIIKGSYFGGRYKREVIIGARTAKALKAKIGSKVVVTIAQAEGGELQQDLFKVAGIFQTGESSTDGGIALVKLVELQRMLELPGQVHEIALTLKENGLALDAGGTLWTDLSNDQVSALNWVKLEPQFAAIIQMMDMSMALLVFIVFSIVGVGIVNTMFMSIFERIREFGILRALGTRPSRIGLLIMLEAFSLAVVASALGLLLGLAGSYYMAVHGIDYTGLSFSGVQFREPTRAVIHGASFIGSTLIIVVSTVLVSIYPAVKAMAVKPVDAMREIG